MLEQKMDPRVTDLYGYTALHWAAARANTKLLVRLLGTAYRDVVDIDAVATYGARTPLISASISGHPGACKLLLEAHANVAAKDATGKDALYWARKLDHGETAVALRKYDVNRKAAAAFTRGTVHARRTHKRGDWTDSKLFDKHLIALITSYVTTSTTSTTTATASSESSNTPHALDG
jgi:ankyrin repeat protein